MDIFRAQFWYYCHLKQHEKQQLKQSQYSRCCERQMSKALMSYCLQDVIFGAVVEHAGHTGLAWCGKVSSDKWIPKLTVPLLHQPFQGKGEKPNSYIRAEPFPFFSLFCWVAVIFVVTKELWGCASDVVYSAVVFLTYQCLELLPCAACVPHQLQALCVCQRQTCLGAAVVLHMAQVRGVLTEGSVRPPWIHSWSQ